jgi:FecR protein.
VRVRYGVILVMLAALAASSLALRSSEARVTQVVGDVRFGRQGAASVNETVTDGSAVQTGGNSRAEVTFSDLTITRVGASSLLSLNQAGHVVELDRGAILLRVPKNAGGGRIRTNILTVSIAAATVLFEAHPGHYAKLIVLEGHARASLDARSEKTVMLHAGQMLIVRSGATHLPAPIEIDLDRVMKTASLITRFPPLPSLKSILSAIENQKGSSPPLANPDIVPTGLDARDVVASIRSQATPSPPKSGRPPGAVTKP